MWKILYSTHFWYPTTKFLRHAGRKDESLFRRKTLNHGMLNTFTDIILHINYDISVWIRSRQIRTSLLPEISKKDMKVITCGRVCTHARACTQTQIYTRNNVRVQCCQTVWLATCCNNFFTLNLLTENKL